MVLDESKLCYSHEIGFGQVVSYRIHRPNGGGNLALHHCGGSKKKREASNMHGFPKIEHHHEKESLSFTFYEGSTKHGGKT
jgi:hypothetical protein